MHLPQVHKEVADQRHGEQGGRTGCQLRQQGIEAEDQAEIEIYRGSWLVAMMINVIPFLIQISQKLFEKYYSILFGHF